MSILVLLHHLIQNLQNLTCQKFLYYLTETSGGSVDITDSGRFQILERGELLIVSTERGDSGIYVCNSSNSQGHISASASLSVYGKFLYFLRGIVLHNSSFYIFNLFKELNIFGRIMLFFFKVSVENLVLLLFSISCYFMSRFDP